MNDGKPRDSLLAVYDKDLVKLLASYGLLEILEGQGLPCSVCGSTVTFDSLKYLLIERGKVVICCDKSDCFYTIVSRVQKNE